MQTLAAVTAVLKEVYEGRIQNQQNEEQVALKRIEQTSDGVIDTVGGKYVTFPVRVRRNAGISYRAENTQIANPGQQTYAATQVPLKYGYGRFKISGQAMELAESNYQAFASVLDEEMDRLKGDIAKDANRIAYGNGTTTAGPKNGAVAFLTTATAGSATQTVSTVQYLEIGMVVDLMSNVDAVTTAGLTINNINESTNVVTFSSVVSPTASAYLVRTGNYNLEPTGFWQIIRASGILHNIDPASQPVWVSNLINNSGSPGTPIALTELKMIQACDLSRRKGGKITAIFTSLGVRRSYFSLLTQQRRYTEVKNFPGGFVGLAFNYGTEVPVVEDPDASPNKMWFVDEPKMKVFRRRPWHFVDADGDVLKWVKDYDVWEGMMRQYWEIGTNQRNAHTLYDDITES